MVHGDVCPWLPGCAVRWAPVLSATHLARPAPQRSHGAFSGPFMDIGTEVQREQGRCWRPPGPGYAQALPSIASVFPPAPVPSVQPHYATSWAWLHLPMPVAPLLSTPFTFSPKPEHLLSPDCTPEIKCPGFRVSCGQGHKAVCVDT